MGAKAAMLSPSLFDKEIIGFSVDSRSIRAGEIFFALSQEDYARAGFNGTFEDGHRFIPQALEKGALGAVARYDRVKGVDELNEVADRLLLVDDAIAALQLLAQRVYEAWGKPVVGITGSAGKTTAKELTAHVIQHFGKRVLKSERNYNNGLGLPLSVLQMVSDGRTPDEYELAVLEMGMSSPSHEIQRLCRITPPDIGVELLVAPVHLEYLGSIENIAAAKEELIEGLKPGGTAVLNADDDYVIAMRERHTGPVLTFGIEHQADVMATEIETGNLGSSSFNLLTPLGETRATLRMPGRHNLMNALAASAVATCFKITPSGIAAALASFASPKMRGEVIDFARGFTVVDDTYNSNPRSLISMVRSISGANSSGRRRIVVAGEMLELGPDSQRMHREVGLELARMGINVVWGVHGHALEIVEGAGEGGAETRFFETSEAAGEALVGAASQGDLILVKGSRGVQTDKVVAALRDRFALSSEEKARTR
jgi:UDP-N-acetylmuramoyl-tripeptide--D-alanyl-D-alanine ligase